MSQEVACGVSTKVTEERSRDIRKVKQQALSYCTMVYTVGQRADGENQIPRRSINTSSHLSFKVLLFVFRRYGSCMYKYRLHINCANV